MKAKRIVNLVIFAAILIGSNMNCEANTQSKNQEAVFAAG